jgi:L-methionine (R)-S-oxide reductase
VITLKEFLKQVEGEDFREECESICGLLREMDRPYDWVGIYWVKGENLILGPWSGPEETEHKKIPISQGICGAAVRDKQTIVVDDVQADPRYLACFPDVHSEIVVPIRAKGKIVGEIDIDGKPTAAFTDEDKRFLEELAEHIGNQWPGKW